MTVSILAFARGPFNYAAVNPKALDTSGLLVLAEPFLAKANYTANTSSAVNSAAALAAPGSKLLQVQIDSTAEVHVRVTKSGTTVEATTTDPKYSGEVLLEFGPGYSVSFLEAS